MAVKGLEDEIRMIKVEISEMDRKIKVGQDKIVYVPKLATQVIEIQQQIQ